MSKESHQNATNIRYNISLYMFYFKIFICIIGLIIIWSAYKPFHEKDDKILVLRNKYFFLIQDLNSKEYYNIYFRDSISAIDTIKSIKQAIIFCAAKERNNPYIIRYRTTNTEKLNHLFFEKHGLNKKHLTSTEIEVSKISNSYDIFLRKQLFDNGCILDDSAFIITPDMDCYLDFDNKLGFYSQISIYFNWHNMTNYPSE